MAGGLKFNSNKKLSNPDSIYTVFLICERKDANKDMSTISPFLIKKCLENAASGKLKSCRLTKNGDLIIECFNTKQAAKVIQLEELSSSIHVNISEHQHLNVSKGMIYTTFLKDLTDAEIIAELSEQGVTALKRFKNRDKISRKLTDSDNGLYLLTFNATKLPMEIHIGYYPTKIRPYIPNPLRCFKCFRFGHINQSCNDHEKCPNCCEDRHIDKNEICNNTQKCANCSEAHNSFSKNCLKYQAEFAIQKIKVEMKIPLYQARIMYHRTHPERTYSDVMRTCKCKCSCSQQDLTNDQDKTSTSILAEINGEKIQQSPSVSPEEKMDLEEPTPMNQQSTINQPSINIMNTYDPKNFLSVKSTQGKNITILPKNSSKRQLSIIKQTKKIKLQNSGIRDLTKSKISDSSDEV
jgi:hypothetical protein